MALIAWLVRGWSSRSCVQCHDLLRERAARRVALLMRAGRPRPMANETMLLLLITLAFLPIERTHRALLAASAEGSAATHWLVDAALVGTLGVAIVWWPLGLRRLDRGVAPGPLWIWLYGHAMLPMSAPAAREESNMWPGMVELAKVTSRNEAEIIAGVLESEGVTATLAADDGGNTAPSLDYSRFVRVMVAEADFARAKDLLAEHVKLAKDLPESVEPPDPDGV